MNLFNTASAKNLQTTHLINQHTVHAAPVLALPPEDKTSLFRRSIQHNYADLLKIAEDSDMAIGLTDHHGTLSYGHGVVLQCFLLPNRFILLRVGTGLHRLLGPMRLV